MVAGTVIAGDARPVKTEDHRKAVETHVVIDLVPGSVEERGVDRDDRSQAAHGHACGRVHSVLLCDADVEETFRVAVTELVGPGMAAVMATISGRTAASRTIAEPKASV